MASRIIAKIENFLKDKNVEFERNYIAFKSNGKLFEVVLKSKEKRLYRVMITKDHRTSYQDFRVSQYSQMINFIVREMEGYEDD